MEVILSEIRGGKRMQNGLTKLLHINYPIIQAPMAGGVTTTELVTDVSTFGGLGSIGAGYMSADQLRQQIKEIRERTNQPFSVNLFVPAPFHTNETSVTETNKLLDRFKQRLHVEQGEVNLPLYDDVVHTFHEQINVVIEEGVP